MENLYYVGLDVHKRFVTSCAKTPDGVIAQEAKIKARRADLTEWARSLDRPWIGAMEATLFTGWIYDTLAPHAQALKTGHPAMMRAIGASKKKNDRLDARKIADMVRCNLLPECYMAPRETRELRRALRHRNFLVRVATRLKNKTAGLLMECGAEYDKRKLHGKKYFQGLMGQIEEEVPASVREMLRFDHGAMQLFAQTQKRVLTRLAANPRLRERVERLATIGGVGVTMALTWALEIGDPARFGSIRKAVSYCGLCAAQRESAGKGARGPLSKQRNKHLQTMLIEVAKLAPLHNPRLKEIYDREAARSNKNQATLAVARRMVAYLLAVDRSGKPFELRASATQEAPTEEPADRAPQKKEHATRKRAASKNKAVA
jgi:transposase